MPGHQHQAALVGERKARLDAKLVGLSGLAITNTFNPTEILTTKALPISQADAGVSVSRFQ